MGNFLDARAEACGNLISTRFVPMTECVPGTIYYRGSAGDRGGNKEAIIR